MNIAQTLAEPAGPLIGDYSGPDERKLRARVAQALILQGNSAEPVRHWTQGLAKVAQALTGGYMGGQIAREGNQENSAMGNALDTLVGISRPPVVGAPPQMAPRADAPMTGGDNSLARMATISAAGETGTTDFNKGQFNISPDTGGSRSYGIFGLNSGFGRSAGGGSAGQFASSYPSLGLTARPGSPQFDAQWKTAAQNMPDQLQGAQLDWYQKNILPQIGGGLAKAGVPDTVSNDPRVQAYFADRSVQQGPQSTSNHANRIAQAAQASGGDPVKFLQAMSAADRQAIPGDFRTYLSARPQDVRGLGNRIATREQMAMAFAPGAPQAQPAAQGDPAQAAITDALAFNPQPGGTGTIPGARPQAGQQLAQAAQATPGTARAGVQMPPNAVEAYRQLRAIGTPQANEKAAAIYEKYSKPADYHIHNNPDGTVTVTNKSDPRDTRVVNPGQADSLIRFAADKEAATTAGKLTAESQLKNLLPGTSEEAMKLRKEFRDESSYKNLAQSVPVYKSMVDAAGRDNRAADVNLIYGMAKLMDPGSVVRESEMTVAQAVATLPQSLQAQIKSQLAATGRLDPDVREAIMVEAQSRVNAYKSMFDQDAGQYSGIAERNRMRREDIIPTFPELGEYKAPAKTQPASGGFDRAKAKAAGYTDAEIDAFLSGKK